MACSSCVVSDATQMGVYVELVYNYLKDTDGTCDHCVVCGLRASTSPANEHIFLARLLYEIPIFCTSAHLDRLVISLVQLGNEVTDMLKSISH